MLVVVDAMFDTNESHDTLHVAFSMFNNHIKLLNES